MEDDVRSSRKALQDFVQELNQTCLEIQESTSRAIKEQKQWNENATREFKELMDRMKISSSNAEDAGRRRSAGALQQVKVDEDEPLNEPIDVSLLHSQQSERSKNPSLAVADNESANARVMSYEDILASHMAVLSDETLIDALCRFQYLETSFEDTVDILLDSAVGIELLSCVAKIPEGEQTLRRRLIDLMSRL
uniref:Uncharacterized protein n=1 Tax=Hanusia phi TaxID=3032 RepID=A0A7S0I0S4_9CRYP